ncbi:MAG TPA: anti-sigma factor [Streptosporangiaceae bacterium]|nr:anti-sigma factor [Streptosporangiaceae bacterium]
MTDIHTLAGAYALDAVDELERARFDRHLAECPSCAAEVAELTETMAALSDGTAEAPPPGLRAAVLARSAVTPQARRAGREAPRTPAVRWQRLVAAAAAVLALGGAGAVGYQVASHSGLSRNSTVSTENKQIAAVLAAPDARLYGTTVTEGGHVTVISSPSLDKAVAVLTRLPSPGSGHTYQLWVISHGTPRSAGVLAAGSTGATELLSGVRGAQAIGVSREPAGGSTTPTQPLVTQLPLA